MEDQTPQANRLETLVLTLVFTIVSCGLFALLPWQTRSGPENSGWWTQPVAMPAIALGLLSLANLETLRRAVLAVRTPVLNPTEKDEARTEIIGWFRPLEYFAYFLVYLFSLKFVGYFLSTTVFIQFLLWRSGLRSTYWRVAGLCAAITMTAVFRWGLGIWVPTAEIYDLFPHATRKFLTRWF